MREIRQSGSEGGEPQSNAACLPLSFVGYVNMKRSYRFPYFPFDGFTPSCRSRSSP